VYWQRLWYPLMPIQSELFPPDLPNPPNTTPHGSQAASAPSPRLPAEPTAQSHARKRNAATPIPIWLQRLSLVVLVTFCLYIGLLLVCLPWTRFWYQNPYLFAYPQLGHLLLLGATRGVISGIGFLDIWIGLTEAVYYRDFRAES